MKTKLASKNGITFVHTERMLGTAKKAMKTLKELGVKRVKLHQIEFKRFACGEVKPRITCNVRKDDVFLFFDFNGSPNEDIMNFLLTLDALHLADVERITPVVPYMPYLRQDRKDEPRVPISAALFIRMIELCPSVKRLITIDMHAEQLQAVFTIPTDHLPGRVVFTPWVKARFVNRYDKLVAVAPDFGSAKRVRKLAETIDEQVGVSILEKKRDETGTEILSIIGAKVKGKICLLNDDMMDTCGTIINAANALYKAGAEKVIISGTHAIFSPTEDSSGSGRMITAYEKLHAANVDVVVTDSLVTESHAWLTVLPLADYLAHVIYQHITSNGSVSKLIRKGIPR